MKLSWLGLLLLPTLSLAQAPVQNLHTLREAEQYANQLLASVGPATLSHQRSFTVFHVGEDIPHELGWVVKTLNAAGHEVKLERITSKQVLADLEADSVASKKWIGSLTYLDPPQTAAALAHQEKIMVRAKRLWRRLAGIPNGFSFWFEIKKTKADRWRDAGFATFQALTGAASVGISYYLQSISPEQTAEISYIAPAVTVAAWVLINGYYQQNMNAVFGQGRSIKKVSDTQWTVGRNAGLTRLLSFTRSMISNVLIMSAAFGPDIYLNPETALASWTLSVSNSLATLFSRFWFDEIVQNKQPGVLTTGAVVVRPGQWTPKKLAFIKSGFDFTNGLLKNLHLSEVPFVEYVFPTSGIYGLIRAMYVNRKDYPARVRQFLFGVRKKTECNSLLVEN